MTDKPTILYIEDDAASRSLVARALSLQGYHLLVADTGLQGIDIARQQPPDLILTDINLPDLNGHEIATALRSDDRFRRTPIVALSAQGYSEHYEMAFAAGVNGFLSKPLEMETLADRVHYYLNGGRDSIDPDRLTQARARYTQEVGARLEAQTRELEEANQTLQKFQHIKETFIQITAHELRTPLTLVYGYLRLLEQNPLMVSMMQHDATIPHLLDGLAESVGRMHAVIDEILTISRIMTQRIELATVEIALAKIVAAVLDSFAGALAERDITIHFDPDNGWPHRMSADGDLLHLAFINLIGNAIKYTPDGGHVTIECAVVERVVRIVVRDTGIGIDPAEKSNIFTEFHMLGDYETHSTSKTAFGGGGLGLGLPICRGIIEAHGGAITVSSPGRNLETLPGSAFTVELPLRVGGTVFKDRRA
jgi:signal transduction histidine kinase